MGDRARGVARGDPFEQIEGLGPVRHAEQCAHAVGRDRTRCAIGGIVRLAIRPDIRLRDHPVEQGEAVAHRPVRGPGEQGDGLVRNRGPFAAGDIGEMGGQFRLVEPTQVEALAARQDGHRNLADFRRREDELHMLRRLFEGLQQGVEGVPAEHVDFVDDVDLEFCGDRPVTRAVDDFPDIVDAGVGGGVHLQHVDVAVLGDRDAVDAGAARLDRRATGAVRADAVERAGDQPGGCRLADAAHTGEDEGVVDTVQPDGVGQRPDENVLADQFIERGGPVFARENAVFRSILRRSRCCGFGTVGHRTPEASPRCRAAPARVLVERTRRETVEDRTATRAKLVTAASFRT